MCIFDPTDWTGQSRTNWTVNIMKYERGGGGGGGGDTSHWIHQTEETASYLGILEIVNKKQSFERIERTQVEFFLFF